MRVWTAALASATVSVVLIGRLRWSYWLTQVVTSPGNPATPGWACGRVLQGRVTHCGLLAQSASLVFGPWDIAVITSGPAFRAADALRTGSNSNQGPDW